MVKISDDVLAIAVPDEGKLLLYNFTENSLIEKKLDWQPKILSVEEQKILNTKNKSVSRDIFTRRLCPK